MSFKDFELALKGEEHESVPIWFMRQAGRYLPEFRAMRGNNGMKEICSNSETVVEISTIPIQKFNLDAAIIFHDLVLPLEGMGFNFQYLHEKGPVSDKGLKDKLTGNEVHEYAQSEDPYPLDESIRLFRSRYINTPLIGFTGGPLTLLSYIVQNRRDPDLGLTRDFIYTSPSEANEILEMITNMVIGFSKMQIKSGITALQIFDSWIGHIPRTIFINYYERYLREVTQELSGTVPLIYFSTGSSHLDDHLQEIGFDFLSLDWRHDLPHFVETVSQETGIQGNLDPAMTRVEPEITVPEINRILEGMKTKDKYIFNLGHGIPPDARVDTVRRIAEAVHAFGK